MSGNKLNPSSSLLGDNETNYPVSPVDPKAFLNAGSLPTYTKDLPLITTGFESKVNRSIGSYSMSPPALSMSPPSLSAFGATSSYMPSTVHLSSYEMKEKSSKVTSTKSLWKVTDSSVPTLPERHPLERTAVFMPYTSASIVASRITYVLRERSISSKFSNEKAKVKCITSYNVDFRIRLYRGKDKFSHGIIAEVQRRFGFSPHFHSDTQAILEAAEGKTAVLPSLPHPSVSDNDLSDSAPLPSLDLISKLISSSRYDSQVLALNRLTALTDSTEVGQVKAQHTIKSLLSKEHETLCSHVFSIVRTGYFQANEIAVSSVVTQYAVREKAMTVVTRIVKHSNAATRASLKSLTPMIISSLKNANEDTRLASCSVSLVFEMLKYSCNHSLPESDEIFDAIISTRSIGEVQNKQLSELSNRCIELMT